MSGLGEGMAVAASSSARAVALTPWREVSTTLVPAKVNWRAVTPAALVVAPVTSTVRPCTAVCSASPSGFSGSCHDMGRVGHGESGGGICVHVLLMLITWS